MTSIRTCVWWPLVHPGFRHRVKGILEPARPGATGQDILEEFPYLDSEDSDAVLTFAALQNDHAVLGV